MKKVFFSTGNGFAPLSARLLLALVLFPHGAQKLLGWFGGFGFNGTMNYFTGTVGLPWAVGFLVIVLEFFGPLALLFGVATRFVGFALACVFAGIVLTTQHDYFFMNWFGAQKGEGAEFFLLAIGLCLSLVLSGAGRFSVDALLARSSVVRRPAISRAERLEPTNASSVLSLKNRFPDSFRAFCSLRSGSLGTTSITRR